MSTTTPVAARILDALGDALRRRGGAQLEDLVDGLAAPIDDADRRLAPTARGWAGAFDLDTSPEPKWIGTAIGSTIPGGLTVAQQREYIRARAYWRRGTPEAIRGAVRSVLVGATRRVDLLERNGSPWRLKIRVWASELPGLDEAPVAAAARTQTPVGIVVDDDVEVIDHNATYAHLSAEHGTYAQLKAHFPTPAAAAAHVPEEGTVF